MNDLTPSELEGKARRRIKININSILGFGIII